MELTYYDRGNLLYSSYYLAGIAQNAARFGFRFRISGTDLPVRTSLSADEKPFVLVLQATNGGRVVSFCIDTRDRGYTAQHAYDTTLLGEVAYYFKVNYNRDAIERTPELHPYADRIHPILPFFPIRPPGPSRYLPRFTGWDLRSALRRMKHLREMPTLAWVRSLHRVEPDLDVVYVVAVSGKPEHRIEDEFRYELAREIQNRRDIAAKVGLVSHGDVPRAYAPHLVPHTPLKNYLRQQARARVAIYSRGLHDCLSFKLGQMLVMGRPIVGQTIRNNREQVMNHDRFAQQFVYEDPKAIVARVHDLLASDEERRALSAANRAAFEAAFSPDAVVSRMLETMGFQALSR